MGEHYEERFAVVDRYGRNGSVWVKARHSGNGYRAAEFTCYRCARTVELDKALGLHAYAARDAGLEQFERHKCWG